MNGQQSQKMASEDLSPLSFPGGDVRILLTIKDQEQVAMASSHALSAASPVWKKLVYPPREGDLSAGPGTLNSEIAGAKADSKSQTTIPGNANKQIASVNQMDFREDDSRTLLILFRIAHLEFRDIPAKLEFDALYNMAVLLDKYQCLKLVQPWLKGWLGNEKEFEYLKYPRTLFIAWVFGQTEIFDKVSHEMVKYLEFDPKTNRSILMKLQETDTMSKDPVVKCQILDPMPPGIIGMSSSTYLRNLLLTLKRNSFQEAPHCY